MFVAGLIGSGISSSTKTELSPEGTGDTVRPIPGWWYFIKRKEQEQERTPELDISEPKQGDGSAPPVWIPIFLPKGIPQIPSSPALGIARPFPNLSSISPLEFLKEACPDAHANTDNLLHSSFGAMLEDVIPQRNGFVHTILECQNECHALTIRPDDVWIAIISQFSCFLNGNADALRSFFVLRDGKKELSMDIYQEGQEDLGLVVQTLIENMKEQMQNNIVNLELMQWIIPAFSTTNPTDELVSGIIMMATVKQYFTYQRGFLCGVPRVTLEGQRDDWVYILNRIERLKEFGPQTTAWYRLLCPILSRFINSFQESDSAENLEFWRKVAYFERFGSDERKLSGWITAFMVFDEEGRWKGDHKSDLILGGIPYPRLNGLDSVEFPAGYAQVNITLQRVIGGPKYMTSLIAGSIGTGIFSSGDKTISNTGKRDSARPALGWWWVLKKGTEPQDSTLAPSDKFPWRFIDANAFMSSGAIRIVSFDDISELDFVAISYVWTDGIKKWRNCIFSTCGRTYEETIERGSGMLSISTEPADISDGDGIAHAHLFLNIVAFFVLTRGKKFFWIDILCINQDDQREKSFYVPRMGDLYRRAAETHAYPFGANIAPSLLSDEVYFPIWETRAWTVQEQILSKRVLFCYAFQGDVRQDLGNLRSNAGRSDPERLVDMHTPVLDRYQYADGIFLLETKENMITCRMEEEEWTTLPGAAWIGPDVSALNLRQQSDLLRGLGRGTIYKVLARTKISRMTNTAEAARISMLCIAMERKSTIPEDMIYSMLGVFDLGNFRVEYGIGLEEARLRVFEALSPKILAHIIGTEWGSKSSANNKDSVLPQVVDSLPVSCIVSLESAIRHCKYTRNVGTWMNCRREKFRVWAPATRVRFDKRFLRVTLGNDQLLPMHIASIFNTPE
ncbi:hypothetical protein HD554DRAFT_2119562, partial [Boletus coccyginus]